MVFYFQSELVGKPYIIYMGADKYENDQLIQWGWPEDVWFHVDKLSSAHVYLRLRDGETLDDVPTDVIQDCAQLCKHNSIQVRVLKNSGIYLSFWTGFILPQGCKENNVPIVYTMWENLKKTGDMDVGQVGFHKSKLVRKLTVEKRIGDVIKRLEKTKTEVEKPDLRAEREARDEAVRQKERNLQKERERAERQAERIRQKEQEARSYDRLFTEDKMTSNVDGNDSDEFM